MKALIGRFGPQLLRERRAIIVLVVLAVMGVAVEALLPWPLKLVIDSVLSDQALPAAAAWLAAWPGGATPTGLLAWLAVAVVSVFLVSQGLQLVRSALQIRVATRLQYALGAEVLGRAQELSLLYHRRARKGDLARRITVDTNCLGTLLTGILLPVAAALLMLVVLFTIMWQLDSTLAILAAVVAVPMGAMMRLLAQRMTDRAYEHQEAEGQVWSHAEQTLTALPVVQAFGREAHESARFSGVAERSIRAYMRSLATQVQFKIGVEGCEALGVAAVMLVGGIHVLQGQISLGTLVVFLSYLTALYAPLLAFAYLAPTLAGAMGSARRVLEVMDARDVIESRPHGPAYVAPAKCGGGVRMEGVVFGYRTGEPVLRGIDLEVRAGETVALVGRSGAGKSTLVALIPRLFDPWRGRVMIDGHDVRTASLDWVRAACAIVLQEPFMLPLTVAENIAYGRPAATRSQIETAARAANAHEFIERLDHGYDTVLGERGMTLSAGQRQRLSIARALLKDAPVLIMDEPTSALDLLSEASVLQALERLKAGRTSIVIAHRLSTIRRADRIVVLDQGQIAEDGPHDALIETSALYRALYLAQLPAPHTRAERTHAAS